MNEIPVATKMLLRQTNPDFLEMYPEVMDRFADAMRDYAKMHVKAALEEAAKTATYYNEGNPMYFEITSVYPSSNIQ